jgi:YesN/AraC family two-component response regulator
MTKKRILVLEDEALIAHDIKRILEAEGYETLIDCFNVDMAIEMSNEYLPDLILIDINLNHKKTGIDFASFLTKRCAFPFIFISSYSDKNTLDNLLSTAHSGFIAKPFKPQDLISTVYLVLNSADSDSVSKDHFHTTTPFAITQVIDFIHKNIRKRIDVESLATMTSWETEYFGKLFKSHLGISPYQYILKQKVEEAKQMLTQSDFKNIEDLSFELGFSSYSNFYNAFKKHTNLSPQEFRKLVL